MKAIVDNNLPLSLARRLSASQRAVEVNHVVDLGVQDRSDEDLRRKWRNHAVIWITRDEDFWLDAPERWAIVWVNCHNPRLAFLRDVVAPAIAGWLAELDPGARLLVTESVIALM